MNRLVTATVFIVLAICIAVTSLLYINHAQREMEELLKDAIESAVAKDTEQTRLGVEKALNQWEKHDDLLNIFLGQTETNDVKNSLNMAMYFLQTNDLQSVILYINDCRCELERIKTSNAPSFSTIL